MADLNKLPIQRDPATKDAYIYLAGPVAMAEMVGLGLLPKAALDEPFHALGESLLLNLQRATLLNEWLKSGDVVMLRTEKTDG